MLFSRLDRFLNTLNHCLDIVLGFLCLLLSKVVLMEVYNFLDWEGKLNESRTKEIALTSHLEKKDTRSKIRVISTNLLIGQQNYTVIFRKTSWMG